MTLHYFSKETLVCHVTPGCSVLTVDCICTTEDQATRVAARLNQEQQNRQKAVEFELALLARRRTT